MEKTLIVEHAAIHAKPTNAFDARVALIEMAKHAHRALNAAAVLIDRADLDAGDLGEESPAELARRCSRISTSLFTLVRATESVGLYEADAEPSLLTKVIEYLDSEDGPDGPGHWHAKPGMWDDDNGRKSGTKCEWCATWRSFKLLAKLAEG